MDHLTMNRRGWDQRTAIHIESKFYDVAGFVAGNSSLNPLELTLLGDVCGLRLLHLQCHFGLDSLSWARLGAEITGVDLSPVAIAQARQLSAQIGIPAEFVCDDVLAFGQRASAEYDWVFTSYGALCWLPDLALWAQGIANALKPGGRLALVEFHPAIDLHQGYSYFHQREADVAEEGTYTENCPGDTAAFALWGHSIGETVTALLTAGLVLEQLQEHDSSPYRCFDGMVEARPGCFQLLQQGHPLPMLYSLVARKPAPSQAP
ncbi:class I SAM-dependent methyltransferase [Ferrimonas pelagia]|uniref:Class I SAM-dependent methyltransferase n=1 Tax=Ferrimonas pelagia TaxID=1177826 RepID=A0ABP9ELN8_9GAMM